MKGQLYDALRRARKGLPKQGGLIRELLKCVVLEADAERGLMIKVTDLETSISQRVSDARVSGSGAVAILGRQAGDLVGTFPDECVTITFDEGGKEAHFKCGSHRTTVKGVFELAEDYPVVLDQIGTHGAVEVTAGDLRGMDRVVGVAAKEDYLRVLSCVYVDGRDGATWVVTSDNSRLASGEMTNGVQLENALLPEQSVKKLTDLLPKDDSAVVRVSIARDERAVFAWNEQGLGETVVTMLLMLGAFPDYRKIADRVCDARFTVETDELERALKVARAFVNDKYGYVRVGLERGDATNEFVVRADGGAGSCVTRMDAVDVDGAMDELALRTKFVYDAVNSLKSERLVFEVQNGFSATLIGDGGYKHIIAAIAR